MDRKGNWQEDWDKWPKPLQRAVMHVMDQLRDIKYDPKEPNGDTGDAVARDVARYILRSLGVYDARATLSLIRGCPLCLS